jgi:hypothetical protein
MAATLLEGPRRQRFAGANGCASCRIRRIDDELPIRAWHHLAIFLFAAPILCDSKLGALSGFLFTPETWAAFQAHGTTVSGFRERQRRTAEQVNPGDIFLYYLVRLSRWCGVLDVASTVYIDSTPISIIPILSSCASRSLRARKKGSGFAKVHRRSVLSCTNAA